MIQILGLRDSIKADGTPEKRQTFFKNGWRANSLEEILGNPNTIVEKIPEGERYNIYFTVADCFEDHARKLKEQHHICFDVDDLTADTEEDLVHLATQVAKAVCTALKLEWNHTGVIFSGHGVQLFVRIPKPIVDELYFDSARPHYAAVIAKAQRYLEAQGMPGTMDSVVFSKSRLMRMPNTLNRKPNKPVVMARVLQPHMAVQEFYLDQASGIADVKAPDQIALEIIKRYPAPDTKSVLAECEFIKDLFLHPEKASEPQWFAGVSVVARLEDGPNLVHKMSEGHSGYSHYETEEKIAHATTSAGPRTCKNISTLSDKCKLCKHYGTGLVSPIMIRGPNYIKSKDHGFRAMRINEKTGAITYGKPEYEDLLKTFGLQQPFITIAKGRTVYVFNGKFWEPRANEFIKEWMRGIVAPKPSVTEMDEFIGRLLATNVRDHEWFNQSMEGHMNFSNGVLDWETMTLKTHSDEYGFTHVLPYAYDPYANAPLWEKTLMEIAGDDRSIFDLVEEFFGYAISGSPCLADKALVLLGKGANGKSVLAETLAAVAGKGNYSNVTVGDLANEQYRIKLMHKLFNHSDESSAYAFRDTSIFKTLVTGGEVTAKEVYMRPIQFKNKTKLIVLANELPKNTDTSDGMYRRLEIVQLKRQFFATDANKNLRSELEQELPGICNRLIQAFKRLVQQRYLFTHSASGAEALREYQEESSSVHQFYEQCLERTADEEDTVENIILYKAYQTFCNLTGERAKTNSAFFKELCAFGNLADCRTRIKVNGRAVRGFNKLLLDDPGKT